jgi:hypothetical protein
MKMEECPAKHALVEERPRLLSLGKQQIKWWGKERGQSWAIGLAASLFRLLLISLLFGVWEYG